MRGKRILPVILALALLLTGCGPLVEEDNNDKEFSVYASFYPVYALSSMIIKEIDNMNLACLIQPQDGCLRSYALSDWDLYLASNADLVIVNGNGLESFESILSALGEEGPAVIGATSGLVLYKPEITDDTQSHFHGANPWLFLSVEGAKEMLRAICAGMIYLDPGYEEKYAENLLRAENELTELKEKMSRIVGEKAKGFPVAVAHEGLLYFANEWETDVRAVIQRESGVMPDENELSEMLQTLEHSGAKTVLIEKQAPQALLKALKDSGYNCALMNTLSAGNAETGTQGYFDAMIFNAESLAEQLKEE